MPDRSSVCAHCSKPGANMECATCGGDVILHKVCWDEFHNGLPAVLRKKPHEACGGATCAQHRLPVAYYCNKCCEMSCVSCMVWHLRDHGAEVHEITPSVLTERNVSEVRSNMDALGVTTAASERHVQALMDQLAALLGDYGAAVQRVARCMEVRHMCGSAVAGGDEAMRFIQCLLTLRKELPMSFAEGQATAVIAERQAVNKGRLLMHGKHSWRVLVNNVVETTDIGVASEQHTGHFTSGTHATAWGVRSDGTACRKQGRDATKPFRAGSVLGFELDLGSKTLAITVDGEAAVVHHDVEGPVYVAMCGGAGASASILL